MSKSRRRFDEKQGTIFELIEQINAPKPKRSPSGQFRIIKDLRQAIKDAIRQCPSLSRHQIAGEMSHLLDESITKAQIDSWTRDTVTNDKGESVPNTRHVPAEYMPAFCEVTGCDESIRIQARKRDCHLMPPRKAIDAEIAKVMRRRDEDNKLLKRLKLLREEVEKR